MVGASSREPPRFGGVRQFLLLGSRGGLAAVLYQTARPIIGLVLFAGGLALVLVAYLVSAWRGTIDATSEVAGLLVLGAGAAAGFGMLTVASVVAAGTWRWRRPRGRMHAAVARLESVGLEAGARFASSRWSFCQFLPQGRLRPGRTRAAEALGRRPDLRRAVVRRLHRAAARRTGPRRQRRRVSRWPGVVDAVTFNFARESCSSRATAAPAAKALALGVVAAGPSCPLRVGLLLRWCSRPPVAESTRAGPRPAARGGRHRDRGRGSAGRRAT